MSQDAKAKICSWQEWVMWSKKHKAILTNRNRYVLTDGFTPLNRYIGFAQFVPIPLVISSLLPCLCYYSQPWCISFWNFFTVDGCIILQHVGQCWRGSSFWKFTPLTHHLGHALNIYQTNSPQINHQHSVASHLV